MTEAHNGVPRGAPSCVPGPKSDEKSSAYHQEQRSPVAQQAPFKNLLGMLTAQIGYAEIGHARDGCLTQIDRCIRAQVSCRNERSAEDANGKDQVPGF